MSLVTLDRWTVPARRRVIATVAAAGAPAAAVLAVVGWRFGGSLAGLVLALGGAAAIGMAAWIVTRRYDRGWLVRGLDSRRADLEDSADLLFAADASLSPLQRLQRDRLLERLAAAAEPDLRPAWPLRALAVIWIACALAMATLLWRQDGSAAALAPSAEGLPSAPGVPRLTGQRLRIVPPAYTGLPTRDVAVLDARAPEGSRLQWTLDFAPAPSGASLAFHDAGRLPLARDGAAWRAGTTLTRSVLYRVMPAGSDWLPPLHRLDAIPDRPPSVAAKGPTLALVAPGQRAWVPTWQATDDYGVGARAQLRITLAQGEGEQVTFRERTIAIAGSGPPRARRFAPRLDLAALDFTGVGDLIAQVTVADARGHAVRGPSLILRRPAPVETSGTGLDGAVKAALPAYFRSQRQIIIDAEALIRERRRLAPDRFTARSDGIGVDQRTLRMRYGQFLGEESEGPSLALPTSDEEHSADDGHDHAPTPSASAGFGAGSGADVVADYGHTHGNEETATLLDPDTRETLRQALDQMWQSELHLRQGDPAGALPFANRALVFIKRVQQATRIFLRRTGSGGPPIDLGRRLTGKRDGLAGGTLPLAPPAPVGTEPGATWAALAIPGMAPTPVSLDRLERWLRGAAVPDRLALAGAIDAVRREPGCAPCRERLRAALWAALPPATPRVGRRPAADAIGRRYLDSLPR